MTEYLLCVLIVTVAYFIDVVTTIKDRQREPVGFVVLGALIFGGILYGLLRLIGWLVAKYGGGVF